tara:strand:+ start:145 stop:375 length:231 start_codon:yes stop_codon:yes gene_type:complete
MTSISLKINESELKKLLKTLERFDIKDLVIEEENSFEQNESLVQESLEKYATGADKTFSIEEAESIIDKVISAYED